MLFVTPYADFAAVVAEAETFYPDSDVVACTTAGELGANGYEENQIVGIGFPAECFVTTSLLIQTSSRWMRRPPSTGSR